MPIRLRAWIRTPVPASSWTLTEEDSAEIREAPDGPERALHRRRHGVDVERAAHAVDLERRGQQPDPRPDLAADHAHAGAGDVDLDRQLGVEPHSEVLVLPVAGAGQGLGEVGEGEAGAGRLLVVAEEGQRAGLDDERLAVAADRVLAGHERPVDRRGRRPARPSGTRPRPAPAAGRSDALTGSLPPAVLGTPGPGGVPHAGDPWDVARPPVVVPGASARAASRSGRACSGVSSPAATRRRMSSVVSFAMREVNTHTCDSYKSRLADFVCSARVSGFRLHQRPQRRDVRALGRLGAHRDPHHPPAVEHRRRHERAA